MRTHLQHPPKAQKETATPTLPAASNEACVAAMPLDEPDDSAPACAMCTWRVYDSCRRSTCAFLHHGKSGWWGR